MPSMNCPTQAGGGGSGSSPAGWRTLRSEQPGEGGWQLEESERWWGQVSVCRGGSCSWGSWWKATVKGCKGTAPVLRGHRDCSPCKGRWVLPPRGWGETAAGGWGAGTPGGTCTAAWICKTTKTDTFEIIKHTFSLLKNNVFLLHYVKFKDSVHHIWQHQNWNILNYSWKTSLQNNYCL